MPPFLPVQGTGGTEPDASWTPSEPGKPWRLQKAFHPPSNDGSRLTQASNWHPQGTVWTLTWHFLNGFYNFYIRTYIHMYIHVLCECVRMCICIYVHIHTICVWDYMYMCIHICAHTGYMYVCTCVHIHKLVYTKFTHGRGYHTSCYKAAHVRGQDRTAGGTRVLDPTG